MAKLVYTTNNSLDGYTEDASGAFDWSEPDDEVHEFFNELMHGVHLQLLGRKMYETMAVWETDPSFYEESPVLADFAAAWQDSDKVVYSTTLTEPMTKRTRILSAFDADEVRALKEAASTDVMVGGPELAGQAFRAGLVDEVKVVVHPAAVGEGKPAFPTDLKIALELVDERRFGNGCVYLAYRVRG